MRHHIDLGLSCLLLQRGNRVVDLLIHLARVPDGSRGVVVDLVEPVGGVAVALEAHHLRLELRAGALDPVDEEDRVVVESLGFAHRCCKEESEQHKSQSRYDATSPHSVPPPIELRLIRRACSPV